MNLKNTLGIMFGIGVFFLGIGLFVPTAFLPGPTKFILIVLGLAIILVATVGLIFSSLYLKSRGNMAYLKTGSGGSKVIMDGGKIIIGFLHEIIPVSLETMKIEIPLYDEQSVICAGGLRANMRVEFYVRVKPEAESIKTAARTLGDKISEAAEKHGKKKVMQMDNIELMKAQVDAVTTLEKEKLISAVRTVAHTQTLEELNSRIKFKESVIQQLVVGLKENGMEVEDVTMSHFDQAPLSVMDENNSFDVQGLKNLQQIIAKNKTAENKLKRDAELAIKQQDVETRKEILKQEQAEQFAVADKEKEVRSYQAEQDKEAAVAEIENNEEKEKRAIAKQRTIELESVQKEQDVDTAQVEKEQAIEAAGVEKRKTVETAEVNKQKAVEAARVEKDKTVELAIKQKSVEVAEKDAKRALADEKRNEAEAKAETAKQKIETVKVTETAKRDKEQQIIRKQAEIQKDKQEAEMKADVTAYKAEKEAEGRKKAATADYDAKVKGAEADQKSKEMAAAGLKATQMVPVIVEEKRVEVKEKEVAVERMSLENQAEFEKISKELKLQLAEIEMKKDVNISYAGAMGSALSSAKMTLWGDTESFNRMCEAFRKGQEIGTFLESAASSMPKEVKDVAAGTAVGLAKAGAKLVEKFTGQKIGADVVQKFLDGVHKEEGKEESKSD